MLAVIKDFWDIADFLKNIGDVVKSVVNCIPDFLRPLALAFIVISAVYLIAGRQ